MAQHTVELRNLLRTNFQLFDFDYQFDDSKFKKQLEEHVIDYFYSYEIGFETPDMFKQKFRSKWLRVIPYYNELYNTTLLSYNPLINQSVKELTEQLSKANTTNTSKGKSISDSQTTSESDSNQESSDYPQQPIMGGDYLSGQTIAQTGSEINNATSHSDENTNNQTSNNESTYERVVEGLTGTTYQELIRQQRENILRIPDMIVREMSSCFMLIY